MGRWIEVSIQPQQYQRMLDFYPRSDGSKCPSNHNNIKGCWISIQGPMDRSVHPTITISEDVGFLSKVRWIEVSIQPQQYQRMLNSIQGPMDRSVHPTTTISEDVGFLSKVQWIEVSIQPQQYQRMLDFYPRSDGSKCPSNHNNIKGCWISIQGPMDRSFHPTTTISKD